MKGKVNKSKIQVISTFIRRSIKLHFPASNMTLQTQKVSWPYNKIILKKPLVWVIQVGTLRTVTISRCPKFRYSTIYHPQIQLLENLTEFHMKITQHLHFDDPLNWIISVWCYFDFMYKIKLDSTQPNVTIFWFQMWRCWFACPLNYRM